VPDAELSLAELAAGEPSDAALLARTAGGERAAFDTFVARHRAAVYRFARAVSRDGAEAEDVLQEAFLAAYRGAHTFEGRAQARSWLFTITRREAWRRLGRDAEAGAVEPHEVDDLIALGVAAGFGSSDPETLVLRAERREAVVRALGSLAEEDRAILLLRDVEGLSGEEAAEALGLAVPAMKSRLHRARLRLAAALRAERGGGEP